MANKKTTHPTPTVWAAGNERQPFSMVFSPASTSQFSQNINVDREPVKVVAFGLRQDEFIEILHLAGEMSGSAFEAYKPFDGALVITSEQNEVTLARSGRYRLRFQGTHGQMYCFWWQFSMTHEWMNEVLANGLRQLCECLQPPPFEIVAGTGIQVTQLSPILWHIANTFAVDVADTTTIDHTVTTVAGLRVLSSNVLVSPYAGNLIQVRPDGLYVNLSSQLTPCGFGALIQPSPDRMPLRLLALNEFNCITSIPAEDVARYLCNVDCTPTVNLSVVKTASPENPQYGELTTFTVTISNSGPEDAVDLLVRDSLPPGFFNFEPIPITYTGGAYGPPNTTRVGLATGFYCGIPAGGSLTFTVQAYPWQLGRYTNTVFVELLPLYINEGNSFATVSGNVVASENDLSIKIVYHPEYTVGEPNYVIVEVANNSPVPAPNTNVAMSRPQPMFDPYPAPDGEVIVSRDWTSGLDVTFTESAFGSPHNLGTIPPGGKVYIRLWLNPALAEVYSEYFSVYSDLIESDTINNTTHFLGTIKSP